MTVKTITDRVVEKAIDKFTKDCRKSANDFVRSSGLSGRKITFQVSDGDKNKFTIDMSVTKLVKGLVEEAVEANREKISKKAIYDFIQKVEKG